MENKNEIASATAHIGQLTSHVHLTSYRHRRPLNQYHIISRDIRIAKKKKLEHVSVQQGNLLGSVQTDCFLRVLFKVVVSKKFWFNKIFSKNLLNVEK